MTKTTNKVDSGIWLKIASIALVILTTLVVVNSVIDYKMQSVLNEIAEIKEADNSKASVRVIDTKTMAEYFTLHNYDTRTQLEYIDILKILLDKSNIIAINDSTMQFKSAKYKLKLNDIETLRETLARLGIENPAIKNAEEYEERENLQKELFHRLTQKFKIQ